MDAFDESAEQKGFYLEVLQKLVDSRVLHRDMSILVTCAGETDRAVFDELGFRNVVISNIDERLTGDEFAPFEWSYQDVARLSAGDAQFDFCVVHSGLHHLHSPHQGLLEMYRVARTGVLMFEPYDNLLTRLGVKLGIGQEYETAAVFYNDCAFGGVENTDVPNYVMRWTVSEFIKTIRTYAPYGEHRFLFFHRMRIPWIQLRGRKNALFSLGIVIAAPFLRVLGRVFPKQGNNFAAVALKPAVPDDLHPWLTYEDGTIKADADWLADKFISRE